jgi:hypothetical protein
VARPSLCSFYWLVLVAIAVLAVPASALGAPPPPALTGTNPGSPGASQTPHIQGRADGVIISVIRPPAAPDALSGMAVDPNDTITIYAGDPTCSVPAAIAAVGTAGALEGAGIPVSVAQDSTTAFYATQSNATGTSICSPEGTTYRQVTTPPATPVLQSVDPASPANDNSPRLFGTTDPETTVDVYAGVDCSGIPVASGSAADFESSGIAVSVADNSTTTFHVKATLAEIASACSASSLAYQEVTPPPPPGGGTPPGSGGAGGSGGSAGSSGGGSVAPAVPAGPPPTAPELRTVPGGSANDNTPLVTGRAPGASAVQIFANDRCAGNPVAKGSAAEFAAGLEVQVVDNATIELYGVALNGGGRSACSAAVVYVEDSTAPHTRITLGPGAKTRKRSAVFRFADVSGDPLGATFACKVDRGKWRPCHAPLHLRRLGVRSHVVRVKAIDAAGNRERGEAKRRFRVVPGL